MQIGPVSGRSVRNITRYFHWTFPCADKILCAGRGQIRPMKHRHRQVEVEHLEDRADQSLGLAQRQMEHCAQRQSFRNCEVGVVGLQPGVVRGAAFQAAITSSVNHTVRLPRCRSASLYTHALPGTLRPPASSTRLARSRPKPSAAGPDAPRPLWRCPPLPAARDDVPDDRRSARPASVDAAYFKSFCRHSCEHGAEGTTSPAGAYGAEPPSPSHLPGTDAAPSRGECRAPNTAFSSLARCSLARLMASRRLVLIRSPGRFGINEGATTTQSCPGSWIWR